MASRACPSVRARGLILRAWSAAVVGGVQSAECMIMCRDSFGNSLGNGVLNSDHKKSLAGKLQGKFISRLLCCLAR